MLLRLVAIGDDRSQRLETNRNVFDVLGRLICSGRFRDGQLIELSG